MSRANNSLPNITSTQLPHTSQPPNNPRGSGFVRRLIIGIVWLLVVVSAASSIAWLIIHPLCPVFTVSSFTVSNFNPSDKARIKAEYELIIAIGNPNKKVSLVVDLIDILLLYKKSSVTKSMNKEAVRLEKMSQQNLSLKFSSDLGKRLQRREFDEMIKDWSKRVVSFNVNMEIRNRFRYGIWLTKRSFVKVSCMDLVVQFSAPGKTGRLKGGGKDCLVHST